MLPPFSAVLDRMYFIRACNDDIHESLDEFEILQDPTTGIMATDRVIIMEKTVLPLFLGCFYPILFILAGNDDMHESSKGQIGLLTAE